MTNAALIRKYCLVGKFSIQSDRDYSDSPNICNLSEFKKTSISYIAGYVARTVEKQILCCDCSKTLGSAPDVPVTNFLNLKDRGKLFKLTQHVIDVCAETEKCFERLLAATGGNLPHGKLTITNFVMNDRDSPQSSSPNIGVPTS